MVADDINTSFCNQLRIIYKGFACFCTFSSFWLINSLKCTVGVWKYNMHLFRLGFKFNVGIALLVHKTAASTFYAVRKFLAECLYVKKFYACRAVFKTVNTKNAHQHRHCYVLIVSLSLNGFRLLNVGYISCFMTMFQILNHLSVSYWHLWHEVMSELILWIYSSIESIKVGALVHFSRKTLIK